MRLDLTSILKVAGEFGITRGNQRIASNILTINNVRAAGLNLTQGLYTAGPFYWDLNDQTRAFAQRFNPRHPKKIAVNEYTAGVYSTVRVPGEENPCVKVTFPCRGSANVY